MTCEPEWSERLENYEIPEIPDKIDIRTEEDNLKMNWINVKDKEECRNEDMWIKM